MLLNIDFDGVVVDSLSELHEASVTAARQIDALREPTIEDFRTLRNLTFLDLGQAIDLSAEESRVFVQSIFQQLRAASVTPRMFDGMPEVVRELSVRHKIVIVTSTNRDAVERVLQQWELTSAISGIADADQAGSKTEKILRAIQLHDAEPTESFMVGDSYGDIVHGKRAGVRTIGVTWGFQPESLLKEAKPDYLVREPYELLEILP